MRAILAFCLLMLLAPPAAGTSIILTDCWGVDHPPFNESQSGDYAGNGASYLLVGIRTDTFGVPYFLVVERAGSGDFATEGTVPAGGIIWLPVPIFQFGPHVANWDVNGTTFTQSINVDDQEPTCDESQLTPESVGSEPGTPGLTVLLAVVLIILVGLLLGLFASKLTGTTLQVKDPCAEARRKAKEAEAEAKKAQRAKDAANKAAAAATANLRAAGEANDAVNAAKSGVAQARGDDKSAAESNLSKAQAAAAKTGTVKEAAQAARDADDAVAEAQDAFTKAESKRLQAASELAECEGPDEPASAPPAEDKKNPVCCPCGTWRGVTTFVGGGLIGGYENGTAYLHCVCSGKRARVSWSCWRVGAFGGGEASAGFIQINGATHATDLAKQVQQVMSGFDFDVSLGAGWSKLGKAVGLSGKAVPSLLGAANSARKARAAAKAAEGSAAGTKVAKEMMEKAMKEAKDAVQDLTPLPKGASDVLETAADLEAKGGASLAQSGTAGIHIPLGVGVQIGLWRAFDVEAELLYYDGCELCGSTW